MIDFPIVECIDDKDSLFLTKGEKYYLLKKEKNWWFVLNDRKWNAMYKPSQFRIVLKINITLSKEQLFDIMTTNVAQRLTEILKDITDPKEIEKILKKEFKK